MKENCVRGQGKVRQGSWRSVSGVKEKCVRGQGEVHCGSRRSASAKCVTKKIVKENSIFFLENAIIPKNFIRFSG